MVGLPNVKEIVLKLLGKWISIPMAIMVTCMAGAALNLTDRFKDASDKAPPMISQAMMAALGYGYNSGILPGLLVDSVPGKMIAMLISAVLSAIAFGGCSYTIKGDFTQLSTQLITIACLFLAGLSGAIATMVSMTTVVKNFHAAKVHIMLAGVLATYMKLAPAFEMTFQGAYFMETDESTYLMVIGVILTAVYVLGSFCFRDADLPMILDKLAPTTDPSAAYVYHVSTSVYLFLHWVVVMVLMSNTGGLILSILFLVINFLLLGVSIFMIYRIVKSGKMPSIGLSLKKKKPDKKVGEMFTSPKFLLLCLTGTFLMGAATTY
jgi:hypothetical protein